MKKLDIRFDTEKVNSELMRHTQNSPFSRSEIARAAMNIGLDRLRDVDTGRYADTVPSLIEEFK